MAKVNEKYRYKKSIFMFTRDLRLEDNTTLLYALENSNKVIPIFIFNPKQVNDDENDYKSDNCVQFMCECLDELNEVLKKKKSKLFYLFDEPVDILEKLIKNDDEIEAICCNRDYTPFARKRESNLNKLCNKFKIDFICLEDYMVTGCDKVKKDDGQSYVKFTPYHRVAKKIKVNLPKNNNYTNYISSKYDMIGEYKKDIHKFYKKNDLIAVHGGRENALKILAKIKDFKEYNTSRDYPNKETTHLSAYIKFNCVSIREVYKKINDTLGSNNKLITQLYWRDFYMSIVYWFPHVLGNPMKLNYHIKWENDRQLFNKWKNGETGIPIIDAGMRQLNTTGWMHNRCRMIVANFLTKILHIDWLWGEKYFAQKLVDYDVANNNGGWGWSSSTGTDSQPYFRVFNPWRQAEKFDKNCEYIKKWIPELKDVPNKDILKWDTCFDKFKNIDYPKPIILDIKKQVKKTLQLFANRE